MALEKSLVEMASANGFDLAFHAETFEADAEVALVKNGTETGFAIQIGGHRDYMATIWYPAEQAVWFGPMRATAAEALADLIIEWSKNQ